MAAPNITAYYRGEHLDDPSGGLLWTMVDRLEDLPFSDSMTLVRRDVDDVFLHVVCRSDGYRLMVQDGGQPMLAYPVEFDATFNALPGPSSTGPRSTAHRGCASTRWTSCSTRRGTARTTPEGLDTRRTVRLNSPTAARSSA